MDEVFYEFKEIKKDIDSSVNFKIEVVLHFLAKVGDTLVLYETRQTIPKSVNSDNDSTVIDSLQKIIDQIDVSLKLIKGKIREIFLSYSP